MAIVVIAIHTNPFANCNSKFVNELAMIIEDMAVPFFFMASGFLLVNNWGDTIEDKKSRLNKKIMATIKIYIVWTLISFPLSIYGYIESGNGLISCIFSYVKYFLFVGKLYNSYHLWYLLALIYSLVIIRILINRNTKIIGMLVAGTVIYIVYLIFLYLEREQINTPIISSVVNLYEYIFNKGGVWSGLLFVTIGMYLVEFGNKLNLPISALLLVVGVAIKYYVLNELGIIISAAMLFAIVLKIKLPDCDKYKTLRDLSKYMYLSHLVCFSIYTALIGNFNKLGLDSFIATLVLSLIVSGMIITIYNRKKLLKSTKI
jgi:peptidoglycan/LPS O-acetylase OafA/YrhL